MLLLFLSFILPLITGYLLVNVFLSCPRDIFRSYTFRLSLAVGVGIGYSSCLYFIWLLTLNQPGRYFIIIEIASVVLLALIYKHLYKEVNGSINIEQHNNLDQDLILYRILRISFYSILISSVIIFTILSIFNPHGAWDACVIYNLRARFIFRGGEHWIDAFSPLLYWPYHTDYPLLIPATVARCWSYMGKESQAAPSLIGMLFTFATVGLTVSSISIFKSRSQGFLAGLVLLGTTVFITHGTSQYADVPLGFFILAANVLILAQYKLPQYYELSSLAGVMAGLACWTKNEGALFFLSVIFAIAIAIILSKSWSHEINYLLYFTLGSLPFLSILLYFKLNLAPPNDLLAEFRGYNLSDLTRYSLILWTFLMDFLKTLPLLPLVIFYIFYVGIDPDSKDNRSMLVLILTICFHVSGYFLVYILSPYNLEWHLSTSLARLIIQLWPSIVYAAFSITYTPEQVLMKNSP